MKKIILLFILLGVMTCAFAQDNQRWVPYGNSDIDPAAVCGGMVFNAAGTPYISLSNQETTGYAIVMTLKNNQWVTVGQPQFTPNARCGLIAIDQQGNPYIAYLLIDSSGGVSSIAVEKFNGSQWIPIGTPVNVYYDAPFAFAISNTNIPYLAYPDPSNGGKAIVMQFNSSNWVPLGNVDFSQGDISRGNISLVIDSNGIPSVAYQDTGDNAEITVMKLNGNVWEQIGNNNFSAVNPTYSSLALDPQGNPYVATSDPANNNKLSVFGLNSDNVWQPVGNAGFSGVGATVPSLVISPTGVMYIAYNSSTVGNVTIRELINGVWVTVDSPITSSFFTYGFTIPSLLALNSQDNNDPFVIYKGRNTNAYTVAGLATPLMLNR